MPVSSVILYTRKRCPLCDEARELLTRHGVSPRVVDIDTDSELVNRFTDCVPVVEIDGHVRFRGHVNEILLKRLLRARQ